MGTLITEPTINALEDTQDNDKKNADALIQAKLNRPLASLDWNHIPAEYQEGFFKAIHDDGFDKVSDILIDSHIINKSNFVESQIVFTKAFSEFLNTLRDSYPIDLKKAVLRALRPVFGKNNLFEVMRTLSKIKRGIADLVLDPEATDELKRDIILTREL